MSKDEIITELEALETQMNRVIKIQIILDEPEDRENIDIIINRILALCDKLKNL